MSQLQSAFITGLPREIRDLIYLELWRSCGLRQHIFWHNNIADRCKSHFCRWPCTTEYQVEDELQQDIEAIRHQRGVDFGQILKDTTCCRRLQSIWLSHWPCSEQAEKIHGVHAISPLRPLGTASFCWKEDRVEGQDTRSKDPYMPMLLSCKAM